MTDIITFSPVVAIDANGEPVAAATAEFFATGTTTPVTVYTDATEATAHPSPLVADGNGVFPAVFRSGGAVKVVVKTPLGATLYTIDPAVKVASSGSAASVVSFVATASIPQTNVQDAVEQVQTNVDAKAPLASPALTGTPTAPTAAVGTNTTQVATTAFVNAQVLDEDNMATNSATRPPSQQSVKAHVATEVAAVGLGFEPGAVPVATPRTDNTSYQNTTGFHMPVFIPGQAQGGTMEVSSDNSTWITVVSHGSGFGPSFTIVPPGWYYRANLTAASIIEYRAP